MWYKLSFLILLVFVGVSVADNISIENEWYHVWGGASDHINDVREDYNEIDILVVNGSASTPNSSSSSLASFDTLSVGASSTSDRSYSSAKSESKINFKVNENCYICFTIDAGIWVGASIRLDDLSTGKQVFSIDAGRKTIL